MSQIDPVFIAEKPSISPTDPSVLDTSDQKNFEGFTYVSAKVPATTTT